MANPLCHWELMVSDVAKAKRFYSAIFGWRFDDTTSPEYTMIDAGAGPAGGMMAKPPAAPMPALNTYFQVDDIARTLRTVVEAGGTVIMPRTEVAGVGWFAMFHDPDGIQIAIFEETKGGRTMSEHDVG